MVPQPSSERAGTDHLASLLAAANKRWEDFENREAAVCPEDVGFEEYIRRLHAELDHFYAELPREQEKREAAERRIEELTRERDDDHIALLQLAEGNPELAKIVLGEHYLSTFKAEIVDRHNGHVAQRAAERERAERLEKALLKFAYWTRPSARDWENGGIRDEFYAMQKAARAALAPTATTATSPTND